MHGKLSAVLTQYLVVRVLGGRRHDPLHDGQVVRPLAEHTEEFVQRGVAVDKVERVVVELEDVLEGRGFVGVDESQVSRVEEAHHVLGRAFVHGDATVA